MMPSTSKDTVEQELARWRRFSAGAIGDRYALMALFLATVSSELKEPLHDSIIKEIHCPLA
jgi:hypothetical protein